MSSFSKYVGNGAQTVFAVNQPMPSYSALEVTLDGKVETAGFTYNRTNATVTFAVAPADGVVVKLSRVTQVEPIHKFATGAAFTARNVDTNFTQESYRVEELQNNVVGVKELEESVLQASVYAEAALAQLLASSTDYIQVGTFAAGYDSLQTVQQTLLHSDGHRYGWTGAFPKTVPAGTTPTPLGSGGWIDRSDVVLRNDLLQSELVSRKGILSDASCYKIAPYILTNVNHDAAFAALFDAIDSEVAIIDLCMEDLVISTVPVTPAGKSITIRNGKVTVTGNGFSRIKTDTLSRAKYDLVFDNVHFVKQTAGGSCTEIDIAWQDATGGIHVNANCSFNLTNGAVGVRLKKSFGNNICGRYEMDSASTAILCDSSEPVAGDTHPQGPMESCIDFAIFTGGTAFDQVLNPASAWNSFEGFSFGSNCRFYGSLFKAKKYNSLKFNGVHGVSFKAVLDSGINTTVCGGYYDKMSSTDWIFKFLTTVRSSQGIMVSGGPVMSGQGAAGDLIIFSDAGRVPDAIITNVTLDDTYLVSGLVSASDKSRGVTFDHAGLTNVSIGSGMNFQAMYSCLYFAKPIARSQISAFMARDVTLYSENTAVGYGGGYNRFDGIYQVFNVNMMVPTYIATGAAEPISVENVSFTNMMRPPVATVSDVDSYFGEGHFTMSVLLTHRNMINVALIKNPSAPGNTRGGCSATITLDASVYIAPL